MTALFRNTILGKAIRLVAPSHLRFPEESDPELVEQFVSLQDAPSLLSSADETTALLTHRYDLKNSDIYLVDWYGQDDPENPLNWSLSAKLTVLTSVCIVTVAMYTTSTFWSVCVEDVVATFHVSETVAQLGTSVSVLGLGIGPMFFSPLSEVPSVGRLRVYCWTALAYILCQLVIPLCNNLVLILILRFVTAVLSSPVLAVGGGTVADMFRPAERGYPMSFWELATWGGSVCGPILSGFVFEKYGYKGPMWELVVLGLVGIVFIVCLLPETYPKNVLYRRAQRLRNAGYTAAFVTHDELEETDTSLLRSTGLLLVKSITLNFREPIVLVLNTYLALIFAIFFGMLESFPYILKNPPHHFSAGQVGLSFVSVFIGGLVSMVGYFLFLRFYQDRCFDENGNLSPEERLWPAVPGSLFIPLGMFWYGWTTHMHWIMPLLGAFWYGVGTYVIFMSILNYLPDAYPAVAATVISGNCLMRAILAAAFPLFTTQFYVALGPRWASSVLGILGILFVPWPIVLLRHGRGIRMKSPNARKDI